MKSRFDRYALRPGQKLHLDARDADDKSAFKGSKEEGLKELEKHVRRLDVLQELLYAEHKHRLLVVLQGMDTSGKDGTIRKVFEGVNPQGVKVAKFGPPTPEELGRDFLWRVHKEVPGSGEMMIFNRSHYEGVLVERVHRLVPKEVWKERYEQIRDFERMLRESGTTVLKFYLHIDENEQKRRLKERLADPTKQWKFSLNDLPEREHWAEYMKAYAEALERTTTEDAPWYVIPSNHPWFRDLAVCTIIVEALEAMGMRYPRLPKDEKSQVVE
jgi:PPK2 family polyphosphate:nucleotide phosphotransferase